MSCEVAAGVATNATSILPLHNNSWTIIQKKKKQHKTRRPKKYKI